MTNVLALGLAIVYLIGFNLAYWMLSTEHKAEGLTYTIGDRIVCLLLSTLSWLTITWCLISSWVGKIKRLGYWDRPVNQPPMIEPQAKLNGVKHLKPTAV